MFILRITIDIGLSKQAVTSQFMNASPSWLLGIAISQPIWTSMTKIVPILALIILAYLCNTTSSSSCRGVPKYVVLGTILSYLLIALHWATENDVLNGALLLQGIERNYIPQTVYAIGFGQILVLALDSLFCTKKTYDCKVNLFVKMVALLSACSSTIIILSGKQGSMFALASLLLGIFCFLLGCNFAFLMQSLIHSNLVLLSL